LRVAKLRFAQQAGGYDKKRDGQHAHHILSPCRVFACFSYYQFCWAGGMRAPEPLGAAAVRRVSRLPMRYFEMAGTRGPPWRRL
jgi:hypothetical protein